MAEMTWTAGITVTDLIGDKLPTGGDDIFVTRDAARRRLKKRIFAIRSYQGQPYRHSDRRRSRRSDGRQSGIPPSMSARSVETEDAPIADLAVATIAGQIKTGFASPLRPQRPHTTTAADRG